VAFPGLVDDPVVMDGDAGVTAVEEVRIQGWVAAGGAIVAAREARECLLSLNELLTKAEGGSGQIIVTIEHIGGDVIDVTPTIETE